MANFCKSVFVFCVAFYVVCAKHEVYDGHALYEVVVKNEDQANFVNGLETKIPVDFFVYAHISRNGQVLVSKEQKKGFEDLLASGDVEYRVLADNIREQLEIEERILAQHKDDKSNRFC